MQINNNKTNKKKTTLRLPSKAMVQQKKQACTYQAKRWYSKKQACAYQAKRWYSSKTPSARTSEK